MEQSFHYLLMAEQSMVQKLLMNQISDTSLSLGQPKVLDYLKNHDGAGQSDIAKGCHIEAPTLTSILNRMEQAGLIERRMLNNNRRSLYTFLTAEGKKYQQRIADEFELIEQDAFKDISEEEKTVFLSSFQKIYANLLERKDCL